MCRNIGLFTPVIVSLAFFLLLFSAQQYESLKTSVGHGRSVQLQTPLQDGTGGEWPKMSAAEQERKAVVDAKMKAHDAVIKRLMRVVHRGEQSPMVIIQAATLLKVKEPDWAKLKPLSVWVEVMGIALAEGPIANGKTYLEMSKSLQESIAKKDVVKLKQSYKLWAGSCSRCHGWSPPL